MVNELSEIIKHELRKENLNFSNLDDSVKIHQKPNSVNLKLVTPEEEKQAKLESLLLTYKLQNEKLAIENESLKTDNNLKSHFAWFVILLLAMQTIAVFVFLFIHYDRLNSWCLLTLIITIIGQSYFLPSFVAKYLFKNNGNTATVDAVKNIKMN